MRMFLQVALLIVGIISLVVLLADMAVSLLAIFPTGTPAKIVQVEAGPYPLTIGFSKYPGNAGYTLPFSIASTRSLTYHAETIPGSGLAAQTVQASISPNTGKQVQGDAEITVRGLWHLHIIVDGPQGRGSVEVPLSVTAPPAIPEWMGWVIGFIPIICLFIFLFMQQGSDNEKPKETLPLGEQLATPR
ncbi:hypothetical protein [Tengunoibacter tsumagoiensis]|uniref:Uncharacterized protein n=1 Tax=Tengunoibacter tsumagoiensis TaxID=2014871 RepID=A0A402A7T0_9CHLR|nr:hypothetical protein [Tengunoibacter tsumagoiensis]GCE15129.1 hypothetical protein KTT_49880 [Tengunoibacter tsumagoiensis]